MPNSHTASRANVSRMYVMTMTSRHVSSLTKKAARLLAAARTSTDPGSRANRYRELADVIVDIREAFTLPTGEPDWRGKSYAYRQAMSDVYTAAHVTPEELITVQQAVRYHVSNALRARLDDETLASIGLRAVSARERAREVRQTRSAIVESARNGNAPLSAAKAIHGAAALLARVAPEDLDGLTATERRGVASALHTAEEAAHRLLEAVCEPSK